MLTLLSIMKRIFKLSDLGPALTRFYILPHIKVHYIHSSDKDYHNHPWDGVSIIFGSYIEFLEDGNVYKRTGINRVYATKKHRVDIDKPTWTLFIHGPRVNEEWQYGENTKPWRFSNG